MTNFSVIQKYIERPFLIQNRKFDIRQWFLVTSWTPLEGLVYLLTLTLSLTLGNWKIVNWSIVWIYDEFYCRFSKKDYNLNDFNKYIHLTNQAIQR